MNTDASSPPHILLCICDSKHAAFSEKIKSLNGVIIQSKNGLKDATHVICDELRLSDVFLGACTRGLWILSSSFVDSSYTAGYWLQEENFEWNSNEYNMELVSAAKNWRWKFSLFQIQPFTDWEVAVDLKLRQYDIYFRILELGGANVTCYDSNIEARDFRNVTYIFLDFSNKTLADDFLSYGIMCLVPRFITETIIKENVDPLDYLIQGKSPLHYQHQDFIIDVYDNSIHSISDIDTSVHSQSNIDASPKSDINTSSKSDIETSPKSDIETYPKSDIDTSPESDIDTSPKSDIHTTPKSNDLVNRDNKAQKSVFIKVLPWGRQEHIEEIVSCTDTCHKRSMNDDFVYNQKRRKLDDTTEKIDKKLFKNKKHQEINKSVHRKEFRNLKKKKKKLSENNAADNIIKTEVIDEPKFNNLKSFQRKSIDVKNGTIEKYFSPARSDLIKTVKDADIERKVQFEAKILVEALPLGSIKTTCERSHSYSLVHKSSLTNSAINSSDDNDRNIFKVINSLQPSIFIHGEIASASLDVPREAPLASSTHNVSVDTVVKTNAETAKRDSSAQKNSLTNFYIKDCRVRLSPLAIETKRSLMHKPNQQRKIDCSKPVVHRHSSTSYSKKVNQKMCQDPEKSTSFNKSKKNEKQKLIYDCSNFLHLDSININHKSVWPLTFPVICTGNSKASKPKLHSLYGEWIASARELDLNDLALICTTPSCVYLPDPFVIKELFYLSQFSVGNLQCLARSYLQSWLMLNPPVCAETILGYKESLDFHPAFRDVFKALEMNLAEHNYLGFLWMMEFCVTLFEMNWNYCLEQSSVKCVQNSLMVSILWQSSYKVSHNSSTKQLVQLLESVLSLPEYNPHLCTAVISLIALTAECMQLAHVQWNVANHYFLKNTLITFAYDISNTLLNYYRHKDFQTLMSVLACLEPDWLRTLVVSMILSNLYGHLLVGQFQVDHMSWESVVLHFFNIHTDHGIDKVKTSSLSEKKMYPTSSTSRINKKQKNPKGETAFHIACKKNNFLKLKDLLLIDDVDVNMADHAGWTPLHEACNHGSYECVLLLLDFTTQAEHSHRTTRVNINPIGPEGVTPLMDAAMNGHHLICKELLRCGGKTLLCTRNEEGKTALDLAATDEIKSLFRDTLKCEVSILSERESVYISFEDCSQYVTQLSVLMSSYHLHTLSKQICCPLTYPTKEETLVLLNIDKHFEHLNHTFKTILKPNDYLYLHKSLQSLQLICQSIKETIVFNPDVPGE